MPRAIQTFHRLIPVEGVLISRKQLKTINLEQQAKCYVKKMLRDSKKDVDEIHQSAYQKGFQQGILSSIQQVVSFFSENESMLQKWNKRIDSHVREMLSVALEHPDTLLLLLDEWLCSRPVFDDKLYLSLPFNIKQIHPQIMELVASNWEGSVHISWHKNADFIIRSGEQIAKFSPDLYVKSLKESQHQFMNDISQDYKKISSDALQDFITSWRKLGILVKDSVEVDNTTD
ncbi:hypothetical protein [Yokenella regensburgei]|uniref:hypothetical protein n=1 Tax=Yokenella regensburgei TaxID=158877 RepID=UPI001432F87E|nr:hypothetical protein [Yokenella regensburgei]QIU92598.1 hypothetical protein HEC60_25205 [Yokenella regensburgei]